MSATKFASGRSIDAEMKRFSKISSENPEKGRAMYVKGELLISLASKGEMSKFRRNVEETVDPEDFLLYFVYKALRASLLAGHLMISSYILDNGYPLNMDGLPNVCHECLKELQDYECAPIVRLLTARGLEINKQSPGNWFTSLHYSIERRLLETVELLVSLGADVNAVGENDVMPLNLALSLPDSIERTKIVDLLQTKGAKETWRRPQPSTYHENYGFGVVTSSSTNISVSNCSSSSSSSSHSSGAKKYVKFSGGGGGGGMGVSFPSCEAQSKTPPDTVFNAVDQISGSAFHLSLDGNGGAAAAGLTDAQSADKGCTVVVGVSSDGGMLFSTGN